MKKLLILAATALALFACTREDDHSKLKPFDKKGMLAVNLQGIPEVIETYAEDDYNAPENGGQTKAELAINDQNDVYVYLFRLKASGVSTSDADWELIYTVKAQHITEVEGELSTGTGADPDTPGFSAFFPLFTEGEWQAGSVEYAADNHGEVKALYVVNQRVSAIDKTTLVVDDATGAISTPVISLEAFRAMAAKELEDGFRLAPPFVMTGEDDNLVKINKVTPTQSNNVVLRRVAARIDIINGMTGSVVVNSAQVRQTSRTAPLFLTGEGTLPNLGAVTYVDQPGATNYGFVVDGENSRVGNASEPGVLDSMWCHLYAYPTLNTDRAGIGATDNAALAANDTTPTFVEITYTLTSAGKSVTRTEPVYFRQNRFDTLFTADFQADRETDFQAAMATFDPEEDVIYFPNDPIKIERNHRYLIYITQMPFDSVPQFGVSVIPWEEGALISPVVPVPLVTRLATASADYLSDMASAYSEVDGQYGGSFHYTQNAGAAEDRKSYDVAQTVVLEYASTSVPTIEWVDGSNISREGTDWISFTETIEENPMPYYARHYTYADTMPGYGAKRGKVTVKLVGNVVAAGKNFLPRTATLRIENKGRFYTYTFTQDGSAVIMPLSNSYIVNGQNTNQKMIAIPVAQANADANGIIQPRIKAGDVIQNTAAGTATHPVRWSDMAANVVTAQAVIGTGPDALIVVQPGTTYGNALVVAAVNGTAKWTWHIWNTDYDPETDNETYAGTVFMDRNLGALNATPGNGLSVGLLYQWGRKDPFPNNRAWANTEPTIFALGSGAAAAFGSSPNYGTKADIKATPAMTGSRNNLEFSVMAAFQFIYNAEAGGTGDWFTNNPNEQDNNLWDNNGRKTPYDPCPKGWRVPADGVWAGLDDTNFPWAGSPTYGRTHADAGYYPASGQRSALAGTVNGVGASTYVWSATSDAPSGSNTSYAALSLDFSDARLETSRSHSRALGNPVRCVKDVPQTPKPIVIVDSYKLRNASNSYIVTSSDPKIRIPVSQANADATTRIGTADVVTAELLWSDNASPVVSVDKVDGVGDTAKILVTRLLEGNAVVAVKVGGDIKWSWHIWATNYNPDAGLAAAGSGSDGKYAASHGAVYKYSGTGTSDATTLIQPNVFMDRNLGAMNATPGDALSAGLLYQWGRKDPFVGSTDFAAGSTTARTIYNQYGGTTTSPNVAIAGTDGATTNNLEYAIANPMSFITNDATPFDWYANNQARQNNNLWQDVAANLASGVAGAKSPYDPCPEGWRVPINGAWAGLTNADSDYSLPWSVAAKGRFGSTAGETWSISDWSDPARAPGANATVGYYPAAGLRNFDSGALSNANTTGYGWLSGISGLDDGRILYFYSGDVIPTGDAHRSYGLAVRCVKE